MADIVVTGGSGFVGSHLVERLKAAGHCVFVPRSEEFDLTDAVAAELAIGGFFDKADIVFHLAATLGGIGYNRAHPGKLLYDNLSMGINVIEACRWRGVKKVILAASVCAYPKYLPVPFTESLLWGGYPEESNAAYGIAKRTLMEMVKAYRQEYGLNGVCLVFTNMFGEGDSFDPERSHVIPALIRKFVEAKESGANSVEVWGTGKATRDFLYVEDAVDALMLAMDLLDHPEPVNIGSSTEITIEELANMIRRIVGYGGAIQWDATKPDGQPRRCIDISRARTFLGWKPKTSLEDGLDRTVEWYLKQKKTGL